MWFSSTSKYFEFFKCYTTFYTVLEDLKYEKTFGSIWTEVFGGIRDVT